MTVVRSPELFQILIWKVSCFCSEVIYNSLISACEKGEQWQRALAFFDEMKLACVVRDTISYNATISACGNGGQWQRALSLLSEMPFAQVRRCVGRTISH